MKSVEVTRISQEPEVYDRGKHYRIAEVNLSDGDRKYNNLAVLIEDDESMPYLDFTRTMYKSFGKFYIQEGTE